MSDDLKVMEERDVENIVVGVVAKLESEEMKLREKISYAVKRALTEQGFRNVFPDDIEGRVIRKLFP